MRNVLFALEIVLYIEFENELLMIFKYLVRAHCVVNTNNQSLVMYTAVNIL